MDDALVFPDWPAKRDAIRAALAAVEPKLKHSGPLRAVPGAVTEADGTLARVAARAVFLDIAGAVEPRMLVELAGDPLDQYAAAWDVSGGAPTPDPGMLARPADPDRCKDTMFVDDGAMLRWCERWRIPIWADLPGLGTSDRIRDVDDEVFRQHVFHRAWGLVEVLMTLHAWRVHPFRSSAPSPFGQLLEFAAFRDTADLGLATALCIPVARWDPQWEDRAAATRRITAELVRAVRAELGRIEAVALRVGVATPTKRTGLEHLAWLARYHFRRETFSAIAKDACVGRQAVADGVKDAAALVGLPLREPTPAGRPRRGSGRPVLSD